MSEVDKELKRIQAERKALEHETETKKKIYENLQELKKDKKMLKEVESDLHPTRARKIKKILGLALKGLAERKREKMERYKEQEQKELHSAHKRKMKEVA